MNDPYTNPYSSEIAAPPRKSNTLALLVLGGVTLLVGLGILAAVFSFRAGMNTSSEAITVGNSFIDNLGAHNYQASESLLSPSAQARVPATELKDMETLLEKQHGAFTNHGQPGWFVQTYNGQTSVRLTYQAQFTKGSSPVTLVLMKGGKGYQVEDCHFEL